MRRRPQSRAAAESVRNVGSCEGGVDPDADHRRLAGLGRVVAAAASGGWPPCGRRRRAPLAGMSPSVVDTVRIACTAEDLDEAVLALEVAVERALGQAGRRDDVVDPRVVVAAGHEQLAAGVHQRLQGALAGRREVAGGAVVDAAPRCTAGLNSSTGGRRRAGGCTLTAWRPNSVRCTTSARASSMRSGGYGGRAWPPAGCRRCRACGAGTRAGARSPGRAGAAAGVVAVSRERNAATWRSAVRTEPPATAASLSAAVWNTPEDRLVALVDLGVAGDPRPDRPPAVGVGRDQAERLGRGARAGAPPGPRGGGTRPPCRRSTGRRTPASSRPAR